MLCAIALLYSCSQKKTNDFKAAGPNAQYKIISFETGTSYVEAGDLVEFKSVFTNNKGEILLPDSAQLNELYNDTITINGKNESDLSSVIKQLHEGDSCLIQFTRNANLGHKLTERNLKEGNSDTLWAALKIKHIYRGRSKQGYVLEENAIARFITYSGYSWKATPEGIYYRIIKQSNAPSLKYNDPLKLVYKGYFLNNVVFDNYAAINPYFEYCVGTQNQLIAGMEIALKYISYGTEAEFIFPSSLAFGAAGSSTGIVPAYKPLLYKVKILERETL
jgi:hypothetical protein